VQTSVVDATQAEMDTCDTGALSFKLR
jgi:hypothetical protein